MDTTLNFEGESREVLRSFPRLCERNLYGKQDEYTMIILMIFILILLISKAKVYC